MDNNAGAKSAQAYQVIANLLLSPEINPETIPMSEQVRAMDYFSNCELYDEEFIPWPVYGSLPTDNISKKREKCASCGESGVTEQMETHTVPYGVQGVTKVGEVQVSLPTMRCHNKECGFRYTDHRSEEIRQKAVDAARLLKEKSTNVRETGWYWVRSGHNSNLEPHFYRGCGWANPHDHYSPYPENSFYWADAPENMLQKPSHATPTLYEINTAEDTNEEGWTGNVCPVCKGAPYVHGDCVACGGI